MKKLLFIAVMATCGPVGTTLGNAEANDTDVSRVDARTKALMLKAAAAPAAPKPPTASAQLQRPELKLAELSAQQIVERNVTARGGQGAWRQVQTLSMSGRLDAGKLRRDGGHIGVADRSQVKAEARAELKNVAMGKVDAETDKLIQLPFQLEMKRPVKTRLEIQFQGQTAVQTYDGAKGWKLRPYLGRHEVEVFTPDELKAAAAQQQLDGPLIDHAAKGTRVEVDGVDQVDGRNAYRLKLTLKGGEVRRLWVDAESFLEMKMEGAPRRLDGRMRQVTTSFRDYRDVDGLKIPYTLETSVDGYNDRERIVVGRVVLNPPLDDARFIRPE